MTTPTKGKTADLQKLVTVKLSFLVNVQETGILGLGKASLILAIHDFVREYCDNPEQTTKYRNSFRYMEEPGDATPMDWFTLDINEK